MKPLSRRALFGLALAAPVAAVVPAVAPAKATVWSRWYEAGCISLNEMRLFEELWEQYRKKHRLESQA